MKKEIGLSQIYFVEGPSCSGKSTALHGLENNDRTVIFKSWPPNTPKNLSVNFFLEQDEQKLTRAREADTPLVLVDRGPLSTLTFYSVLEEQRNISSSPVFRWYREGLHTKKIFKPDGYIFIDIPAAVALKRATSARHIDENNMWLLYPYRIEYWYYKLLRTYEVTVPVYRVDGTLERNDIIMQLLELLYKIQRNI